jgi:hypothetical protein
MMKLGGSGYEVRGAQRRRWHALAALIAIGVVACGESNGSGDPMGPPEPGSILVMIGTSGFLKPDAFEVLVDGVHERSIDANGQVTISGLEPGSYQVALGEVPDNCAVEGVTVSVEPGETAGVSLNVDCGYAEPVSYTIQASRQRADLDARDPEAITVCPFGICSTTEDWDMWVHRSTQTEPESVIRQNQTNGVEIAHLPGVTLEELTEEDFEGAQFTTELIADLFDAGRVILIRTDLGNVFALGNPVEDSAGGTWTLTFDAALIAESVGPEP